MLDSLLHNTDNISNGIYACVEINSSLNQYNVSVLYVNPSCMKVYGTHTFYKDQPHDL